jgi:hypothetical protein
MAGLAMNRLAVGRSFLTFPPIRPSLPLFGSPSHRFNDALEAGSNVFVSLLKKLHLLDLSHLIANSSDCEVRNGCQVARRISWKSVGVIVVELISYRLGMQLEVLEKLLEREKREMERKPVIPQEGDDPSIGRSNSDGVGFSGRRKKKFGRLSDS